MPVRSRCARHKHVERSADRGRDVAAHFVFAELGNDALNLLMTHSHRWKHVDRFPLVVLCGHLKAQEAEEVLVQLQRERAGLAAPIEAKLSERIGYDVDDE